VAILRITVPQTAENAYWFNSKKYSNYVQNY